MQKPTEQDQMSRLVESLSLSFSDVPREHLSEIVAEEYRTLAESRVRDYLPVLVERAVKGRLRQEREQVSSPLPQSSLAG